MSLCCVIIILNNTSIEHFLLQLKQINFLYSLFSAHVPSTKQLNLQMVPCFILILLKYLSVSY